MLISGWGRHPRIDADAARPATAAAVRALLAARDGALLARGMGRSYGDASLAPRVLDMTALDRLIAFDADTGLLDCDAGLRLADLLDFCVPRGWWLPVLPGTGAVTVGGAIAADVHGKNHHHVGSFVAAVDAIDLVLADGSRVRAARDAHADLFQATLGGMGLTGVIVSARLRLVPLASPWLEQRVLPTAGLEETLTLLARHAAANYSVAWVDLSRRGAHRARALIMLGEHADTRAGLVPRRRPLAVPIDLPAGAINRATVRAFNALYHRRGARAATPRTVHYTQYFFPLDALGGWNRLYGRQGFVQHQCVLPFDAAPRALAEMVGTLTMGSVPAPLAVLKALGPANDHPLSFAMAGLTFAVDLPMTADTQALCARLDDLVADHGGRLYLAKDASMSALNFRRGYPRWEAFQAVRERYCALARFASLQSRRLGL
ncbi:MAG: FAD-binding protein [Gammaproteobacteria bacterium]